MSYYFSDRESPPVPPTSMDLTPNAREGIAAEIRARVNNGSFGARYPKMCPDGNCICGTDQELFLDAMVGEIPNIPEENLQFSHPWSELISLSIPVVMDIIEFCWNAAGKPQQSDYHEYYKHYHLRFDEEAGKREFRENINRIFQRNQLAYELTEEGKIERLLPPEISRITRARYRTGDAELNDMLEKACQKFTSPDERERREALENLWDAWERIKTIDGKDKKSGISELLNISAGASDTKFRSILESEAQALTDIGNSCRIRHSETDQERLSHAEHVDYLWHRMFAIIHLLLQQIENNCETKPSSSDD